MSGCGSLCGSRFAAEAIAFVAHRAEWKLALNSAWSAQDRSARLCFGAHRFPMPAVEGAAMENLAVDLQTLPRAARNSPETVKQMRQLVQLVIVTPADELPRQEFLQSGHAQTVSRSRPAPTESGNHHRGHDANRGPAEHDPPERPRVVVARTLLARNSAGPLSVKLQEMDARSDRSRAEEDEQPPSRARETAHRRTVDFDHRGASYAAEAAWS